MTLSLVPVGCEVRTTANTYNNNDDNDDDDDDDDHDDDDDDGCKIPLDIEKKYNNVLKYGKKVHVHIRGC